MKIDREDMLELTRRMTIKRNCFSRAAGAYIDAEGFIDGTFNVHFFDLTIEETKENLAIAKTIPFAKTNVDFSAYDFLGIKEPDSIKRLLLAMNECELKNDALLEIFYDLFTQQYKPGKPYAILIYYGCYDIPVKGTDHVRLDDSEEVYDFLIGAVCPLKAEYEADLPEGGFLFPMFTGRSRDSRHIGIYTGNGSLAGQACKKVMGVLNEDPD